MGQASPAPSAGTPRVMELRPATREEFDDFGRAVLAAFHRELTEEDSRHYARIDEPERSLAWFDDGRIVAGTRIYSRHVTVPGAVVPCAGVTAVGVRPTHRRRGLLTAMMRRQLEDVRCARRAAGDPVGVGGRDLRALRLRHRGAQRASDRAPPVGAAGRRRPRRATRCGRGRRPAHVEHMRAVYERVRGERPGMLDRPGAVVGRAAARPGVPPQRRAAAAGRRRPRRLCALRRAPRPRRRGPRGRGRRSASSSPRRRRRARCCGTSCSTRT